MDMKEWIIIGGGALIGLIVLHGLFMAWWRGRDPLRMKIQPGLLPEVGNEDDWLSGELPNGGARVVSVDASDADTADADDADEDIPVLLETADPSGVDLAPIVPERRLGAGHDSAPGPSIRVEVERDSDSPGMDGADPEADEPPLAQAAPVDSELGAMADAEAPVAETMVPEAASSIEDSDLRDEAEANPPRQDAVDDLLVIHLVAPRRETFSGDELVSALRAQDLRFGEMDIFHRLDAATGETVFSVVRAVEPGSFDLTRIEDCAAPGVMAFLRLPSQGDAQEALEDMMRTAEAMADDLGGELLDEKRKPFTALSAVGYRSRALGLAGQRVAHGAR